VITASLARQGALAARLAGLPPAALAGLAREAERLGRVLHDRIDRKLSGEVINRRSGRLAASVRVAVERQGFAIAAKATADAPYAAIHEYGGQLPPRSVLPQAARALAFPWRGQQRFFRRVSLPAVTMPERSFLRAALAELEPEIRAALENALRQAVQA
jgi:phage gpG-like protein